MTTAVGYWTGSLTYTDPYGTTRSIQLGQTDPNTGIQWLIVGLTGFDGPPVSGSMPQRANDHGGWAAPQWYGPRIMTLTVEVIAPSQALRDTARSQIAAVVPVGSAGGTDLAEFVYNEPVPKRLMVRRSGDLTPSFPTANNAVFPIGLAAPDNRKYSAALYTPQIGTTAVTPTGLTWPLTYPITYPASTPANQGSVTNAGDFESPGTVTITGPVVAPSITNLTTNQTIAFSTLTLTAGDVLTVDTLNRQAFLNGQFRSADVTSSWWRLTPGSNTLRFGGTGSGTASITYRDAYQ